MGKVIVILPVFNMEDFLGYCLRSLVAQTWENWYLVAVDDGANQITKRILHDFARQYPQKVKVISQKKNIGVARSLNRALDWIEKEMELEGKWLMRLDADDFMATNKMERQVEELTRREKVDWLGCQFGEIDWQNNFLEQSNLAKNNMLIQLLLQHHCPLSHPTLMWRGSWQKKHRFRYPTNYRFAEDYAAWRAIAPYTVFANLGEVLYFKRYHAKQISMHFRAEQMRETLQIASWRRAKIFSKQTPYSPHAHSFIV